MLLAPKKRHQQYLVACRRNGQQAVAAADRHENYDTISPIKNKKKRAVTAARAGGVLTVLRLSWKQIGASSISRARHLGIYTGIEKQKKNQKMRERERRKIHATITGRSDCIASQIRANRATRCIISEAMHARVQWKVHRRNVIIIVARFAYVTGWRPNGVETRERVGRSARIDEGTKGWDDDDGRVREWFYAGFAVRICMVMICGMRAREYGTRGWRGKRVKRERRCVTTV